MTSRLLAAIDTSFEICIDTGNVIPVDWPIGKGFRLVDIIAQSSHSCNLD